MACACVRARARVCVGSEMSVMAEPRVFVLSVPGVNRLEFQVQVGVRAKAPSFEFLFLALHYGCCCEHCCCYRGGVGGAARDGGLSAAAPLTLE